MQEGMIKPRVPIQLLNISPNSVTMHKGARMASGCTLEADSIVVASIDSNSPSQDILSDHKQQQLWQVVDSAADKLTQAEQEQLYAVLLDYADVFAVDADDLGKTDKLQHTINTGSTLPIRQPPL